MSGGGRSARARCGGVYHGGCRVVLGSGECNIMPVESSRGCGGVWRVGQPLFGIAAMDWCLRRCFFLHVCAVLFLCVLLFFCLFLVCAGAVRE